MLYISYDGILEPLGQSQVLAYLERLSSQHQIHLISYEKARDRAESGSLSKMRQRLDAAHITWHPLNYHKQPSGLATAYDILRGFLLGLVVVVRNRVVIIHARSYVPSVIAIAIKKLTSVKFIFDMRGFWADERIDGGLWPVGGRMYRLAKWFERRFLLSADCVVSLTHAAVEEMQCFDYLQERMPRFEVITTCTDLVLFHPSERFVTKRSNDAPFTLGYVGSVGVWYLFDEVLGFFRELLHFRADARLLILNRGDHSYIKERIAASGVPRGSVDMIEVDHDRVATEMHKMDAGIFFIKQAYSKKASAPTKMGEFLACGIPCIGNTRVGDMATILLDENVGVAIDKFTPADFENGINQLLHLIEDIEMPKRCRKAAESHFSLANGVQSYNAIYESLPLKR